MITSLKKFLDHSAQFSNLSRKMFNGIYKIDHAYRSFEMKSIIQNILNTKLKTTNIYSVIMFQRVGCLLKEIQAIYFC